MTRGLLMGLALGAAYNFYRLIGMHFSDDRDRQDLVQLGHSFALGLLTAIVLVDVFMGGG